jgi:hypothetical protein
MLSPGLENDRGGNQADADDKEEDEGLPGGSEEPETG